MTPDTWHHTITADLRRLEQVLHDVVDIPDHDDDVDPPLVAVRKGDDLELAARRGNDSDEAYARIPDPTNIRRSGRSDPTFRAVTRWEATIANAMTGLQHLVETWDTAAAVTLHQFGRDVVDGTGTPVAPPDAVWDDTGPRRQVVVAPSAANEFVHVRCVWMGWAADAIADWWTHPACADQQLPIRASNVQTATRHLLKRHQQHRDLTKRPGRCLNPHGLHNHPAGKNHVGGVCRRCAEGTHRCADPLGRGCRRPMVDGGRSVCAACRKAEARAARA